MSLNLTLKILFLKTSINREMLNVILAAINVCYLQCWHDLYAFFYFELWPSSFSLFSSFQQATGNMLIIKVCQCLDSNLIPPVQEAIALPTHLAIGLLLFQLSLDDTVSWFARFSTGQACKTGLKHEFQFCYPLVFCPTTDSKIYPSQTKLVCE